MSSKSSTRSAATTSEEDDEESRASSFECSDDDEPTAVKPSDSSTSKYCCAGDFDGDDEDDQSDREELSEATLARLSRLNDLTRVHSNKTFTADRVREIEKNNLRLMDKILSCSKKGRTLPVQRKEFNKPRLSSYEINRRKSQHKIDWENQILLRKIKSVKPSIKH